MSLAMSSGLISLNSLSIIFISPTIDSIVSNGAEKLFAAISKAFSKAEYWT